MSAFIVIKKHIDYILTALQKRLNEHIDDKYTDEDADRDGQILWSENYRSVNFRYNEATPTPVYKFKRTPEDTCYVQAIQLVRSLDYQSCETDDYRSTEAYELMREIVWDLAGAIPDPDETEWII